MSNANTIRRQVAGNQALTLASVGNVSTTVTAFILNANGAIPSNPYAGEASPILSGGVVPLQAGATGLWLGTGAVMHVRASGVFSGATAGTTTIALTLWEVPAAIVAAGGLTQTSQTGFNSAAATGASAAVTNASGAFQFDAYIQLDGAGNLNGQFEAALDNTATNNDWLVVTKITSVTGLTEADLNFVLTIALGASTAGFTATLSEFAIDAE